ncbi:hypothetical protein D3C85_1741020 [compost metagenome]
MRKVTSIMGLMAVKGTGSPHCAAMRSAQAPAQFKTCGAVYVPASVSTRHCPPSCATRSTRTPSRKRAPRLAALLRNASVVR